jgi:hypothetical protein
VIRHRRQRLEDLLGAHREAKCRAERSSYREIG